MKAQAERIRHEFLRPGPQGPEATGLAATTLAAFGMIEHVERGRARQRRDYVNDQIAVLLGHAQTYSPFWRTRLPPRGVSSLADLPVMTRAQLRDQAAAEGPLPLPPDHGDTLQITTSGSTAEPLRLFGSRLGASYNEARNSYEDVVGGRRLDLPYGYVSGKIAAFEAVDRWPSRTGEVWQTGPGFSMPLKGDLLGETLGRILDGPGGYLVLRPAIVEGLAELAEARGRPVPPIAEIITYGELVTPALRELARRVLGARIADIYSAEEVGPIGFECRRSPAHYHIATTGVVVEVVDERRRPVADGKVGDVLVTGLFSHASPVVRYDIGDRAALLGRCPCGHDGPVLRSLAGRRRSLLRLPDGRLFFMRMMVSEIVPIAPVREARLLQTTRTGLVFEVVATREITAEEREALAGVIRRGSSQDFDVEVRQVPAIDWGPSGKRHQIVNLLEDNRLI